MTSHARSPDVFCRLDRVYLQEPQKARARSAAPTAYAVTAARVHGQAAIVAFSGVTDRDAAEELRGASVFASKRDLPDYDPDDIYISDLLGSAVFTGETWDSCTPLGTLAGLLDAPAQEIWVIATPDGREVLFPATPEFTRDIDAPARKILIAPPPGLIDLYLGDQSGVE